jgi:putative transposase
LIESGVSVSMDGRGWALASVFLGRLWRTVKYEEDYLRDYVEGWLVEVSLQYRSPAEVYSAD